MSEPINVPTLRFSEFEEPWSKRKLNDFILEYRGGAPLKPSDFVKTKGFEVIPKKAIQSGGVLMLDETEPTYCSKTFFEAYQKNVIDSEYLVTTLRDLVPSGPTIGYIVNNSRLSRLLLAQGVYGFKISEHLNKDFLIQKSNTKKHRRLMQRIMVGSTQVHVRNQDFFGMNLLVPTFSEQNKIGSFLSKVDKKIELLTEKKAKLTEYKKGVMQQLFNGRFAHNAHETKNTQSELNEKPTFIPPTLRFKADDGSEFPDWEEKTLGEVNTIVGGGTPSTADESLWGGEIQWFTPTELKSKYVSTSKRTITSEGLSASSAKILPKGTVLFSSRATVGDVSIALQECSTNQGFQSFNGKPKKVLNEFTYYWVNAHKNEFIKRAAGSTFLEISKVEIAKIPLNLPNIKEQTMIANFLSAIDQKIDLTNTELEKAKQWKKGLLQQMFV